MEIGLGAICTPKKRCRCQRHDHRESGSDLCLAALCDILHEFQIPAYAAMKEQDKDFYDGSGKGRVLAGLGR